MEEAAAATRPGGVGGGRDRLRRRRMGKSERLKELTERLKSSSSSAVQAKEASSAAGDQENPHAKQASSSQHEESKRPPTGSKLASEAPCPPPRRKSSQKLQTQQSIEGPSMSSLEEVSTIDEAGATCPTSSSPEPTSSLNLSSSVVPSQKPRHERHHSDVAGGSDHHSKKAPGDTQKTVGKPTHIRSTSANASVGTDPEDSFQSPGHSLSTVPEQGSTKFEEADDLVPLTLPRAESRSIVGSYARRCIPFRSASFSRVDLRPDGRCYVRGGVVQQQPSTAVHVKSSSVGAPYSASEMRQRLVEMSQVTEEGLSEQGSTEEKEVISEEPKSEDPPKSSADASEQQFVHDVRMPHEMGDSRVCQGKTLAESGPGPPSDVTEVFESDKSCSESVAGGKHAPSDSALYWTSTVVVPNDSGRQVEMPHGVSINVQQTGNPPESCEAIVRRVGTGSEPVFIRSQSADSPMYTDCKSAIPALVPLGARSTWEVRNAGRKPRKPRPLGVIRLDEESEEDEELITSGGNRLGITILKDVNTPFDLSHGVRGNQMLMTSKSLDTSYLSEPEPISVVLGSKSEVNREGKKTEEEGSVERHLSGAEEKMEAEKSNEALIRQNSKGSQVDEQDFNLTSSLPLLDTCESIDNQEVRIDRDVKTCNINEEGCDVDRLSDRVIKDSGEIDNEARSVSVPKDEDMSQEVSYCTQDTPKLGDSSICHSSNAKEGNAIGVKLHEAEFIENRDDSASWENEIPPESEPTDCTEDREKDRRCGKTTSCEDTQENEQGDSVGIDDVSISVRERNSSKKQLNVEDPSVSEGEEPPSPTDPQDTTGDSPSSPAAKGGEMISGDVVRKRTRGKRKGRRREEEQKESGQAVPAAVPHRKTSVYSFCEDGLKTDISQTRAANGLTSSAVSVEAGSQTPFPDVAGSPAVCENQDITKPLLERRSSYAREPPSSVDLRDPQAEDTSGEPAERKTSGETAGSRARALLHMASSVQCDPVRGDSSPVQGILGPEYSGEYSVRNASPCPTSPLDSGSMSDAEKNPGLYSLDGRSPMTPRRYSKRPLRGPYGQMLEAEMKRPEAFSKLQLGDDLKFLEDLAPRSGHSTAPILEGRRAGRSGVGHSLDDSALRNSTSSSSSSSSTSSSSSSVNPAKVPPKRKVSAHIPYSGEHLTPSSAGVTSALGAAQSPLVCHQRTTSSPSKLEGISSVAPSTTLSALKPRKSALSAGAKSDPSRGAPSPPPPAEGTSSRGVCQGKKLHGTKVPPQIPDGSGGGGRTDILTRLLTDQMQSGGGEGSQSGKDTRSHVAVELYETERSYVESLQILVHKYLRALKSSEHSGLIDSSLVDEIFFQVPEILSHHEAFLEELRGRLDHWDPIRQQLGDVFLHAFTQQGVIDTYASFINNWKHAKETIKSTCQAKPAFARFLETMAREHKGKLAVDSLLIMPVQRIPRYELLIQMLLKHTEPSHPDHPLLVEAGTVVRTLAQSINRRGRGAGAGRGSASSGTSSGTTIEAWADSILAGPGSSASSGGSGTRTLLRVDQVTLGGKERSFILFSDLLLIASAKRRSGPSAIRKASTMSTAGGLATGLEGHKLKLLMRIPLEDLEIVRGREEAGAVRRALKEAERVQEDLSMVGKLSQMAASLHCSHAALDEVLADLAAELRRRAAEASAMEAPLSQLPLAVHTQSGSVETLLAVFLKAEIRATWEEVVLEAKQKLTALSTDCFPAPEFVSPLPIRKTRAGLQFTCAAPTLPSPLQKEGTPPPSCNTRDSSLPGKTQAASTEVTTRGRAFSSASDIGRSGRSVSVMKGSASGWPEGGGGGEVWVCNSDGYVGQVCVLSLQPEPTVASCNGVCNARILCISAVPAKSSGPSDPYIIPPPSYTSASSSSTNSRLRLGGNLEDSEAMDEGNQGRSGDGSRDGSGNIQLDSSSSESDEEEGGSEEGGCTSQDEISFPLPPSPPVQRPPSPPPSSGQPSPLMADSVDEAITVDPSLLSGSSGISSCGSSSSGGVPGNQATMWLGTEDGCIHVYHCGDNIRTKRNKLRIQHAAAVLCILYLDDRVYISLANGDIVVYTREPGGGWGSVESGRKSVGSPATPVTRMIAVRGRLWCGGNSQIRILHPLTLVEEHSFEVCEEGTIPSSPNHGSRWAWCLAPAAPEGPHGVGGVWVSLQHSALLRLFSPISPYPCLCSIDLTPSVGKMLASSDDIIRQHKAACLRVTALLTCQDLLWVGTSAGVILTLALDRRQLLRAQQVSSTGGKSGANQATQPAVNLTPTVTGLPHGHTGHVRFLTCVDKPVEEVPDRVATDQKGSKSSSLAGGLSASLIAPSSILPVGTLSASPPQSYQGSVTSQTSYSWKGSSRTEEKPTKILVISGGDGYEDFRNSGTGPSSEVAGREDSTNHLLLWQV